MEVNKDTCWRDSLGSGIEIRRKRRHVGGALALKTKERRHDGGALAVET